MQGRRYPQHTASFFCLVFEGFFCFLFLLNFNLTVRKELDPASNHTRELRHSFFLRLSDERADPALTPSLQRASYVGPRLLTTETELTVLLEAYRGED